MDIGKKTIYKSVALDLTLQQRLVDGNIVGGRLLKLPQCWPGASPKKIRYGLGSGLFFTELVPYC